MALFPLIKIPFFFSLTFWFLTGFTERKKIGFFPPSNIINLYTYNFCFFSRYNYYTRLDFLIILSKQFTRFFCFFSQSLYIYTVFIFIHIIDYKRSNKGPMGFIHLCHQRFKRFYFFWKNKRIKLFSHPIHRPISSINIIITWESSDPLFHICFWPNKTTTFIKTVRSHQSYLQINKIFFFLLSFTQT